MPQIYVNAVGPGHFKTLKIALLAGRDFTFADGGRAPGVAIVNETLARRFWPGQDAVGQRLRPLDDVRATVEVVGVVRDSKYVTVGEEPRPFLYRPLAQAYTPRLSLLVRCAGSGGATLSIIREAVRALDAGLPVFNVAPLDGGDLGVAAAGADRRRPAGGARDARAGARGARHLRRAVVSRALAHARDRRPRGHRRDAARGRRAGGAAGDDVDGGRAAHRRRAGGRGDAVPRRRFSMASARRIRGRSAAVTLLLVLVACVAAIVPAVRASRLDPLVALRQL